VGQVECAAGEGTALELQMTLSLLTLSNRQSTHIPEPRSPPPCSASSAAPSLAASSRSGSRQEKPVRLPPGTTPCSRQTHQGRSGTAAGLLLLLLLLSWELLQPLALAADPHEPPDLPLPLLVVIPAAAAACRMETRVGKEVVAALLVLSPTRQPHLLLLPAGRALQGAPLERGCSSPPGCPHLSGAAAAADDDDDDHHECPQCLRRDKQPQRALMMGLLCRCRAACRATRARSPCLACSFGRWWWVHGAGLFFMMWWCGVVWCAMGQSPP